MVTAVADKLREAKALIERGWCQHHMRTKDGCVCIRGAILEAFTPPKPEPFTAKLFKQELRADGLLKAAIGCDDYLGDWNDTPGRTQAEVLAVFDKAIELAEQESVS